MKISLETEFKWKWWHIPLVIGLVAGGGYGYTLLTPGQQPIPTQPLAGVQNSIQCNSHFWDFVYHSERLQPHNDCRKITGIVKWIKPEPDSDYHIKLEVLSGNAPVNDKNIGGYLIVEIICAHFPTKQKDAVQSCQQYQAANMPKFLVPKVGDKIEAVGFYVLDKEHLWTELHPILELKILK